MASEAAAGRRLHPATLLFRALAHARSLLVPALLVIFFAQGEAWQKWLALLFVPLVLFDVFQYFTLSWRFEADELVLREGWLFRNVRHVPYGRVQNVEVKQSPLQRALGVAEARIETAGGGADEAVLKVISLAQCEELRARVFAGRAEARPGRASVETVLTLGGRDLLLLALNPARGLSLALLAWGAAWEFDLLERVHLGDDLERLLADEAAGGRFAQAGLGLLLVLVTVFLLSLAGAVLALWNFRLEQEGANFRLQRGLLTRQFATIPRQRIQIVTVSQNPLQRACGRARVLVGTAGGDQDEAAGKSDSGAQFAPLLRVERVPELLRRIRPEADLAAVAWRPLAPRALRRLLTAHILAGLALSGGLSWALGREGAAAGLLLCAALAWRAIRAARGTAWAITPWGVACRTAAFGCTASYSFHDRLQTAAVRENPLDRRHGHATLAVDTAGGRRTGHPLHLRYLARADALSARERLVAAAAATRFRW